LTPLSQLYASNPEQWESGVKAAALHRLPPIIILLPVYPDLE